MIPDAAMSVAGSKPKRGLSRHGSGEAEAKVARAEDPQGASTDAQPEGRMKAAPTLLGPVFDMPLTGTDGPGENSPRPSLR